MGRKHFLIALALLWLAVIATQAIVYARSEISVRDACGAYLPLAQAAARGDWRNAQSAMFPPVYPIVTGLLSRWLGFAEYPEELAGRIVNVIAMHVILICVLVISLRLFSRRVALVAVGLAGLNPRLLVMSVNVWLEPTYAAVVSLCALVLVAGKDRVRWWAVACLGLGGGLAALIRGEGLVVPAALATCLFICHARRSIKSILKLSAWCALIVVVAGAIWLPRIKFVYDRTGLALPDIRVASIIGAEDRVPKSLWRSAPIEVDDYGQTLSSIPTATWRRPEDTPGRWLLNNLQALLEGWNPLAVLLALLGLIWRRPLARHVRLESAFGLLIAMQLAATGLAHDWQRRYVAVVAPLVAVFAGAGAVALAETLRMRLSAVGRVPWWGRWSCRLSQQLAAVALILLVCAAFCVRRAQRRHSELRYAGEFIRRTYGPGRIIMARTPEPAYYARGRLVPIPSWRRRTLSNAQIRSALRETGAELLLLDKEHDWCVEFYSGYEAGAYETAVVPMPLKENSDRLELFDAARLMPILEASGYP